MLQAVEVKEGLEPQQMDIHSASTTYQMFFSLYPKMCGMTVRSGPPSQLNYPKTLIHHAHMHLCPCGLTAADCL